MRIALLLAAMALFLVGCGGPGDESQGAAPETVVKTVEKTVTKTEEAGETGGAAEQASGVTAEDVLAAFEDEGLLVPEPRDTSERCPELGCESRITTETVSIYEWGSTERAAKVRAEYGFGAYRSGEFTLVVHGDEIYVAPYARVLDEIVS